MAFEEASREGLKENQKNPLGHWKKVDLVMYWQKFGNTIACSKMKSRKCA